MKSEQFIPFPEEADEAKRTPNGWVYRIAGQFDSTESVPPKAVVGAWKVDSEGEIVGDFIKNKNYDVRRWPPCSDFSDQKL